MITEISALKIAQDAILPTRAHPDDAGLDLYGLDDCTLQPGEGKAMRTGIAIALPPGFMGLVADRSSMGKKGIKTAGGVIDAGYRGEIHIILWNISQQIVQIKKGERIGQLLILPVATPRLKEVTSLDATLRGEKGFGSTGR